MKVFVTQLKTAIDLNTEVFELVQSHMEVTKTLVVPIKDHKAKLQLNAQYVVDKVSDFWDFYRIFNAYSIVLGGIALLSEKIYKLKKATDEEKELPSEILIQSQNFKEYLKTTEFKEIMDSIHTVGDTSTVADAYNELRLLSRSLSKELMSKAIAINTAIALNLSDSACKGLTAPLRISNKWNERYLGFIFADTGERIAIHFHGSEEEYELLDNWLSTPELKLNKVDNENSWEVDSADAFVSWFNGLRTRLESECSYQTINLLLDELGTTNKLKYKKAIQEKVAIISSSNSSNITETRKKVIAYLHQLLNQRKGHSIKRYQDFTHSDLKAHWVAEKEHYVLSLYQ